MTRLLIWQWGRRGAGPKIAAELAAAFNDTSGIQAVLSLSNQAEIVQDGLACDMPVDTYGSLAGWLRRLASIPFEAPALARRLRALGLDGAVCAMPAPLDLLMAAALHRARVPFAVMVHDADPHPGDILPAQALLQRRLVRKADVLVAQSQHVAERLAEQGIVRGRPVLRTTLPPLAFGPAGPPPGGHGGKLRLLSFGRLLPYKGLDLLADALALCAGLPIELRVVGSGPETPVLAALRAQPGVIVENRWVPERELGALLAWADAVVLSHREASQSGVAAAAITARRWIVATRVGGLVEQLAGEPLARLCDVDPPSLAAAIAGLLANPPSDAASQPAGFQASDLAHGLAQAFAQLR